MSIKSTAQTICHKCGKEHKCTIYKSINLSRNPELKEKVLSGELFLWECPECGTRNLISYDCLYHDPEEKLMIWMLPNGEPEGPEKDAILNQAKAMGDYRLRFVRNPGELMEKILIMDAGFDDRCIELVKYVAGRELEGVANLHFYRMQDDVMVFSGVKNGKMDGFGFGLNVYQDCEGILERNPDLAVPADTGFVHIDSEWINNILGYES